MDKKYYVQVIAENYLKNVSLESLNVHDKFLRGLSREEFTEGFNSLSSLVCQLYNDIAHNPVDFNMMLKEIEDINTKNTDYTNSNTSFLRVPNLFYILGVSAILESDGVLTVDGGILVDNAKTLKITGLPLLLAKLRDYGFEVSDFGKATKAGATLSVTYIDNRHLTTALKAMVDALSELTNGDLRNPKNDYFYLMNPALLENETVKEPKLTISSIYHALNPIQSGYAATLHSFAEDNTKHSVQLGQLMRNDWSCTYTSKKNKKVLMKLKIDQNKLSVKLNLKNISQYISLVADMPEKILNVVYNGGWECGNCNPRCSGGFTFEIDGKSYNKCHCGSFVFADLTEEDMIFCQKLLEKEMTFIMP